MGRGEGDQNTMLAVSQSAITRYKNMVDRAMTKAKNVLVTQKERANIILNTAEVSAASFLFGLAQGKFGGIEIVGVPIDAIAGIALHIVGFTGVGGRANSRHFHAFADGALASFFNNMGRGVGYTVQTDADRKRIADSATKRKRQYMIRPGAPPAGGQYTFGDGVYGETGGAALADEELARMVAAGRR